MQFLFREFLLNENHARLGQRVGDILQGIQDLVENGKSIGVRQMVRYTDGIIGQIRKILHSPWPKEEEKFLKDLQRVGVALAKAIEEKDDLENILSSSQEELEKIAEKLGAPLNTLGSAKGEEESKEGESKETRPPEKPEQKPQQQQPQQSQQQVGGGMQPPPVNTAPPFGTGTPMGM